VKHLPSGRFRPVNRFDAIAMRWLARHSALFARISLGFVFLAFGFLKFFSGVSPAEEISEQAMTEMTLGLIPADAGRLMVALLETTIGLSLLTGRYLRVGIALLALAMVGVMSPLVLFPDELFAGEYRAPTLEGQYVLKDIVLLAAANLVAIRARGAEIVLIPEEGPDGDLNTSLSPTTR
jgi:uncharacterized membrane protein YphA (DoxX/SURF4 family)